MPTTITVITALQTGDGIIALTRPKWLGDISNGKSRVAQASAPITVALQSADELDVTTRLNLPGGDHTLEVASYLEIIQSQNSPAKFTTP